MGAYRLALMMVGALSSSSSLAVPALYQSIAANVGVPDKALYALAMTETGTRLTNGTQRPWPWTLNVKGKGYYYPSRDAACQALLGFLTRTSSVDIGLTQVNWHWHQSAFNSPCSALEPTSNLTYASQLLKKAYQDKQHWGLAAGAYHRPAGGAPAIRYQQRFERYFYSL
ncbi:hypothetical protein [Vibrio sp. 10N.261.46.A3]|uniref:hypothetical protein n=1 Tax=Vibrio sp. 10N.261.46.A3 TaxID=3229658 RepID=UPI00355252BC